MMDFSQSSQSFSQFQQQVQDFLKFVQRKSVVRGLTVLMDWQYVRKLGVSLSITVHATLRQITLRIAGYHFSSRLTATLNLCLIYLKITWELDILSEHMHNKFEINQTYIKGGCQSGRKVVSHNTKSDLPLEKNKKNISKMYKDIFLDFFRWT